MLAHGEFLHPDAAVLGEFLNHGPDAQNPTTSSVRDQHQHGRDEPPPKPCAVQTNGGDPVSGTRSLVPPTKTPAAASASLAATTDTQGGSTTSVSSAGVTNGNVCKGGDDGGGVTRTAGQLAEEGAEGRAESGGAGGGENIAVAGPTRGTKGTCMVREMLSLKFRMESTLPRLSSPPETGIVRTLQYKGTANSSPSPSPPFPIQTYRRHPPPFPSKLTDVLFNTLRTPEKRSARGRDQRPKTSPPPPALSRAV